MGGWGHSFPNKNHKFWTNENSPFVFPNLTKNPCVGGWVNTFGKDLPKKTFFYYAFPTKLQWCVREKCVTQRVSETSVFLGWLPLHGRLSAAKHQIDQLCLSSRVISFLVGPITIIVGIIITIITPAPSSSSKCANVHCAVWTKQILHKQVLHEGNEKWSKSLIEIWFLGAWSNLMPFVLVSFIYGTMNLNSSPPELLAADRDISNILFLFLVIEVASMEKFKQTDFQERK